MSAVRATLQRALTELAEANADLATANVELVATNAELGRRQSFADALLETIEIRIVSCDADGANFVRNRAERASVRLTTEPESAVGEQADPIDVLDANGRAMPVNSYPLLRALRGENIGAVEMLLGPAGGPHREVICHSSQIIGADGTVLGAVSAMTDVSVERAAVRELTEERRRLTEAQRLGQLGSFTYNVTDRTFTYSDQMLRTWGLKENVDAVSAAAEMIHSEDRALVAKHWKKVLTEGGHSQYNHRMVRPDGEIRHMRSDIELGTRLPDQPVTLHGTQVDVTELVEAERTAKRANAFFDAVLAAIPDPTFVTDIASGRVLFRARGVDILGIPADRFEELSAEQRLALVHPQDQDRLRTANTDAVVLDDGQMLQLRYRAMHADGQWRWLSRRVTPFRRDDNGVVVEVLVVLRDITEAVVAENLLEHGALHDELTGLPNRALLVDRLNLALARSRRDNREIAVLFCDLDSFKRVNDTGGHAAGDAVLLEIARRLSSAVREGDTVARVGGDEFVIVIEPWHRAVYTEESVADRLGELPDRFTAVRIAEAIVEAVREPITFNGVSHVVTASVGITYEKFVSDDNTERATADRVLQDSDAAMYRAKSRGKDRYALFEHALRTDMAERGRVERVLRQALHRPTRSPEEFVPAGVPSLTPAYQPIFDSGTCALVGFEALARLADGAGGTIPPDVFIGVAEDTALIHPLGAVMLDLACGQLRAWRNETPGLESVTMAVNVSALQAQDAALGTDVRRVLAEHNLAPADLVLELTETALLQATQATIAILWDLRSEGVGIAIDDFGTGYASLRYLATLPVTAIKVDRTFTAGLPGDETSRKIVKALAGLAADLELGCVIEGVETLEQQRALPEGVQLQGYLTGRPAAPDALDLPYLVAHGAA